MRLNAWRALMVAACLLPVNVAQARDRGLVIGVNEYPNIVFDHRPGGKNLRGAVPDARNFADLLVKIFKFDPGDVKVLTDAEATNRAILDNLRTWLIDGTGPGDRVVLYFSGHGATAEVREPGQAPRLTSTIVPFDAAGDLDKPGAVITGMIEGKTIGGYLAQMAGRRILVVADSCFSGSVTRGLGRVMDPEPGEVRTLTPTLPVGMTDAEFTPELRADLKVSARFLDIEPRVGAVDGLAVWSAAAINQVSFDLPSGAGGVFTQAFAEGLRDRKAALRPGDEVTAGRLYNYVRDKSKAYCDQHKSACQDLTPELKAEPAYRDLVLNPYRPPGSEAPPQIADEVQNLLAHQNDFPLRAEILPGTKIRLGGPVQFRITSSEPGTLVVLDTGPDGKLRQIFPNVKSQQYNKTGHVNAAAPITIPDAYYGFKFEATDRGSGVLLVLVADQALDLSGVLNRNLDFKAVNDVRGLAVELADKLEQPIISSDLTVPNHGARWAFAAVPYVVEP